MLSALRRRLPMCLAVVLLAGTTHVAAALPASAATEIELLIAAVGTNGCTLVRNGKRLAPRAARRHLCSKLERNQHLVNSTSEFITKLASRSATSGHPYLVRCRGHADLPSATWLNEQLRSIRSTAETD